MAMKRCPICGEKYSETYKKCPFCEEEEALQSGGRIQRGGHRAGKRAASRGQQPNLLSPILVVLIIIMAVLLVYLLFGDKIQDKLAGEGDTSQQTEEITPVEPDITDEGETEGVMPDDEDPSGQTDSQTGEEDTDQETTTTPSDVDSLPETLTMSYLGTPKTEFTMSVGDAPIPLTASGGNGKYTWSSSDEKVATVSSDGKVSAVAAGRATITLTDGSAKGTCVVIVKSGSTGTSTSAGTSTGSSTGGALKAGAAVVVNGGNGVFVRSGPGTSYEALATVSNGASVQIVKSAGDGWYQITFAGSGGADTTGYMKGDYLANS